MMSQLITILARIREWLSATFRGEIARLVWQALALAHLSVAISKIRSRIAPSDDAQGEMFESGWIVSSVCLVLVLAVRGGAAAGAERQWRRRQRFTFAGLSQAWTATVGRKPVVGSKFAECQCAFPAFIGLVSG